MRCALTLLSAILVVSCVDAERTEGAGPGHQTGAVEEPGPCDAGDEAFVKHAVSVLWGRRPDSIREVEVLLGVLKYTDRAGLVRAMTRSEEYRRYWAHFLMDHLGVNRAAFRANPGCYETTRLDPPGTELAELVRDNAAGEQAFPTAWTMADLIGSSLLLDDLSPLYRAQLFAQIGSALIIELEEMSFRATFTEVFQKGYLGRNLACIGCHNSEYSTTDSPDPEADRHWAVEGYFEKAVFGKSNGRPMFDLLAFFRVNGVLVIDELPPEPGKYNLIRGEGEAPWGIAVDCGHFFAPEDVGADATYDMNGWFIADHGTTSSVWDMEGHLRAGFQKLSADGLMIGADMSVDGDAAFAYLSAMALANAVWSHASGRRLTIATGFPRNQAQRDRLAGFADVWVQNSYSLRELLVATLTDPTVNERPPTECGATPTAYHLPAILDPWAKSSEDPELRGNSAGDLMHRRSARSLQNQVVRAMGWSTPEEFFVAKDIQDQKGFTLPPAAIFRRDIGYYLKDSETGFGGVDFQALLAWESGYGACVDPGDFTDPAPWATAGADDFIDQLLAAAPAGATLEDAVLALKDRLFTEPELSDATERSLIEVLLGATLDTALSGAADAEAALRRVCGGLLASPQMLLSGYSQPDLAGTALSIVVPGTSQTDICERLAPLWQELGVVTCGDDGVAIE